ncbi:D-alanine--D-alanine ligase [Pseudomonadales bacterium]|nr:D-alanine--D-alanine ligase [Pseudomonadales bacterium]
METISSNNTATNSSVDALKINGRVAVLMGGNAAEREVSLASGNAVTASLASMGVDVIAIDTAGDVIADLQAAKPDFAFIALHGKGGEDGTMQALLEKMNIPYSGSGVLGSALAMDKVRSKNVWRGLSLPTPAFACLDAASDFSAVLARLGGTAFVKPADEGSSIGMSLVKTAEQLKAAYDSIAESGATIFAEQWIDGPEYTVTVLEGHVLPSIRIATSREFYNFEAKYQDDDTQFFIPSGLNAEEEVYLQQLSKDAFYSLGCSGWGRVDFMRDKDSGQFYLLEVNTVPGLTDHSLVPMSAAAAGLDFNALMANIIHLSVAS